MSTPAIKIGQLVQLATTTPVCSMQKSVIIPLTQVLPVNTYCASTAMRNLMPMGTQHLDSMAGSEAHNQTADTPAGLQACHSCYSLTTGQLSLKTYIHLGLFHANRHLLLSRSRLSLLDLQLLLQLLHTLLGSLQLSFRSSNALLQD